MSTTDKTAAQIGPIREGRPWNQQSYQHLSDPYAAATNPVFWLIHAYVDQWIDRWAKLHNIDEVSDDCGERLRCHQWLKSVQTKPWDGGTDVDHAHEIKVANLPPDLARSLINMGTFVTR